MNVFPSRASVSRVGAFLFTVAGLAPAGSQAGIVTIAKLGDPSPDGNGQLNGFGRPSINNGGQVAFTTENFDTQGSSDRNAMYLGSAGGGPLIQIARAAQTAPDGNGAFSNFEPPGVFNEIPALNSAGAFGFQVRLTGTAGGSDDDRAIYFGTGSPLAPVVRGGQPLPDGNGNFFRFDSFLMNGAGQMAVSATVVPATGGTAKDTGIYICSSTGPAQKVVREGDPAPNGNGAYAESGFGAFSDNGKLAFASSLTGSTGYSRILSLGSGTAPPVILVRQLDMVPGGGGRFASFGAPAITSAGDVTFLAELSNTPLPLRDDSGIYRVPAAGGVELVVRENAPVPVGSGFHRTFTNHTMNNNGRIAFFGIIAADANSTSNAGDAALFLVSGGLPRRQVARSNVAAPGGGTFINFDDSMLALNNSGQVAFSANFVGGGSGLFIGDGLEVVPIIRTGQSLAGGTVTAATLIANTPLSDHHRRAINDQGQVAFFASTLGGPEQGVFVFTPTLNFQGSASSSFDTAANWTLGLVPGPLHDLVFNPAAGLTLTGPAAGRTIKSLTLGGGAGTATLTLQPGVTLTATNGLTLAANGVLVGNGTIAGNVINGGLISPGTSPGEIHVAGNLTQSAAGRLLLELGGTAAGSFDRLAVTQTLTLAGTLDVVFVNGFTPQSGDAFDLMDAATISGTFSTVNLPTLPGGLSWDTANLYSTGVLRVSGGTPSAIQTWRQLHFGSAANSGPGADTADPDNDGTVNLLEFATLTNPLTATTPPVGQALSGEDLVFTYTRNKAALGGVTFAVESSETLAAGSWSAAGITEIIFSDDGTVQQIKATLPPGALRRFVRLSVTSVAP